MNPRSRITTHLSINNQKPVAQWKAKYRIKVLGDGELVVKILDDLFLYELYNNSLVAAVQLFHISKWGEIRVNQATQLTC